MVLDVSLVSAVTSIVVGLLAVALSVLAARARSRSGNRALLFVAVAFAIFAGKSAFSAYNVVTHAVPHDLIEMGLSLLDLAIIALLIVPFLRPRADAS